MIEPCQPGSASSPAMWSKSGMRLSVRGRPVTLPSGWNAAMKIQSVGKTDQTMNRPAPATMA